jgi:pimeloyl-ACP methyl ester carboxylesterase
VLVKTVREADSRTYWDEWESIRCPILIVRGTNGTVAPAHARSVARRARNAKVIEIPDAAHDVHLEQPEQWANVLRRFVRSLA